MMLSLVVVAGAAESGKVDLVIEPKATDTANVVQFDVKLVPQNVTEIGAFQFTLTAQNCTIDKVVYLNNGNDGEDGGGGLQFYKDKVGAENFVNGYFEKFGGEITSNKTVYKFLAAGTARSEYTYGGVTYPAHIWRNPTETLILTLQVTMNDGAKNCSLAGSEPQPTNRNHSNDHIDPPAAAAASPWVSPWMSAMVSTKSKTPAPALSPAISMAQMTYCGATLTVTVR
jgi:hypothetical protein